MHIIKSAIPENEEKVFLTFVCNYLMNSGWRLCEQVNNDQTYSRGKSIFKNIEGGVCLGYLCDFQY